MSREIEAIFPEIAIGKTMGRLIADLPPGRLARARGKEKPRDRRGERSSHSISSAPMTGHRGRNGAPLGFNSTVAELH